MVEPEENPSLKRLRNMYRLVLTNEDTFEEVIAFRLNRWIVFITMSILFVILVGLSISLIAFTPLKYYIPGFGQAGKTKEYEILKVKADSIESALQIKQNYIDQVEKVIKGNPLPLDTATLDIHNSNPTPIASPTRKKRKRK